MGIHGHGDEFGEDLGRVVAALQRRRQRLRRDEFMKSIAAQQQDITGGQREALQVRLIKAPVYPRRPEPAARDGLPRRVPD